VQLCSFLLPTCLRKPGVYPWCSMFPVSTLETN
jgi:hypothetical protein